MSEPTFAELDAAEACIAVPAVDFCAAADDVGAEAVVAGVVVPGSITFLEGPPKDGKTTLMLGLVAAVLRGEGFLGLPTRCSPVVLVSEESRATLREALARAGLDQESRLHIIAGAAARRLPWPELVAAAVSECARVGSPLMVVDTLPGLALLGAEAENDAGAAAAAVGPLRDAADGGLAVLGTRHARKAGGAVGEAGRGSSAFAGAADTLMLLRRIEGGPPEARRITTVSRFEGLPPELDCELVEGRWRTLGTPGQHAFTGQRLAVLEALADGAELTAEKVASAVPGLSPRRAREHLEELVAKGQILAAGAGKKGDPRRFRRIPALASDRAPETRQPEIEYSGGSPTATIRHNPPERRRPDSGVPAPPLRGGEPERAGIPDGPPAQVRDPATALQGNGHVPPSVATALRLFPDARLVTAKGIHQPAETPGPDQDGMPLEWLGNGYPA